MPRKVRYVCECRRFSLHSIGGQVVKVNHTRLPVSTSKLPTHNGWRVRVSKCEILGDDLQRITTEVHFVKSPQDIPQ